MQQQKCSTPLGCTRGHQGAVRGTEEAETREVEPKIKVADPRPGRVFVERSTRPPRRRGRPWRLPLGEEGDDSVSAASMLPWPLLLQLSPHRRRPGFLFWEVWRRKRSRLSFSSPPLSPPSPFNSSFTSSLSLPLYLCLVLLDGREEIIELVPGGRALARRGRRRRRTRRRTRRRRRRRRKRRSLAPKTPTTALSRSTSGRSPRTRPG